MARKVEIEIEILANGQVSFNVKGRKGPSCLEFLQLMQAELGKVEKCEWTAEYYESEEIESTVKLKTEQST